jgi:hypothetical protein
VAALGDGGNAEGDAVRYRRGALAGQGES